MGRGQTFSVGGGSGNDDVDGEEEEDVSEANCLVSEASKPPAGASFLGARRAQIYSSFSISIFEYCQTPG